MTRKPAIVKFLTFLAVLSLFHNTIFAASLNLNPDFDTDGYATFAGDAGGNDFMYAFDIDAEGRYVGVGYMTVTNADMAVWRITSDGQLDPTFGDIQSGTTRKGYMVLGNTAGGNGTDAGYAVTISSDGKILVAGSSRGGADAMVVWKLNDNGTLDTDFGGGDGHAVITTCTTGSNGSKFGYAIVEQSDGKIAVAGAAAVANYDMALWRLLSDGSLDTTFDDGFVGADAVKGCVSHRSAASSNDEVGIGSNHHDYGRALAIQSDGKYVVAGYSPQNTAAPNSGNTDTVVWRFNTNGSLDTTYGDIVDDSDPNNVIRKGYHVDAGAAGAAYGADAAFGMKMQSDGKVLVTGYSINALGTIDLTVWRFTTEGERDPTFGPNGQGFYTKNFSYFDSGTDYSFSPPEILSDGSIVVVGLGHYSSSTNDLFFVKLTPDGLLDETFNGTGDASYAISSRNETPYYLKKLSDDEFIVAGAASMAVGGTDAIFYNVVFFPHTTTLDTVNSLYATSPTVTGTVAAPNSTTNIGSVKWSTSSAAGATWTDCTADDGTFNSLSEDFSCDTSSVNSSGTKTIYVKACDEFDYCAISSHYANTSAFTLDTKDSKLLKVGLKEDDLFEPGTRTMYVKDKIIKLFFDVKDITSTTDYIKISEHEDFEDSEWRTYDSTKTFELSEGNEKKHLYFKLKDTAGNVSITYSQLVKFDTAAPELVLTDIGDLPYEHNRYRYYEYTDTKPVFRGTTEKDSEVRLYVNGKFYGEDEHTDDSGLWEINLKDMGLVLPYGRNELVFEGEDESGNTISLKLVLFTLAE